MPELNQNSNPLHGIKLADIIEKLVAEYGFEKLGEKIKIRCFTENPTIKSSLTFLRKTPWAREKVEQLYLRLVK
ncbi:VF530 family protein [uncultured Flavobacterium sp.]|uniref:VF530 family protein n=1 Tax=uncultured Flavobacterium sp. TaxID=165435 RepID=UPI0030CA18DD|tara:strand:- start:100 stop:321 length:222 start_codon:yes stop_codon:yes gene_type:complete